jgi:predicted nucleic acid-binding Zn ribbon protein
MTDLEIKRFKHREYMRRVNGSLPEDKHCSICGTHMPGRKKSAKFCSNRCRQANKYDKKRVKPKKQLTQPEVQQ